MKKSKAGGALHPFPSLSKSALLLSPCVAWASPMAKWYDDRFTDTSKRDRGTAFHEAIDDYIRTGKVQPFQDKELASWLAQAIKFVDQVLSPRSDAIMSEVAIAVNWVTGEAVILTGVNGRNYPSDKYKSEDGWTFGTADLVILLKDGGLLVADWKTGGTDGAQEQLLSLAFGLQKCMLREIDNNGVTEAHERPVKIACLKVFEAGVSPDERDVSKVELALHKDGMHFAIEAALGGGSKAVPGIHCTTLYCPHLSHCGAVGGIVTEASEGPQSLLPAEALTAKHRMTDKPVSSDEAGFVMARVAAAKRQLDYYTNAMKDYVANGGQVTCGQYTWSKGNDGFRWRKS